MLPKWREKFSPDVVIANIENIAHGKGIGISQVNELRPPTGGGVDIFTGGNHSVEGKDAGKILDDETIPILRPANMSPNVPGRGVLVYTLGSHFPPRSRLTLKGSDASHDSKNARQEVSLLVINLIGQVNMRHNYDSPFHAIDKILAEWGDKTSYKILDWHADATSEKEVMGWYLDGKVSAVFGTHTHVPTADAKILPKGTAYISDIGMVGPHHSIIGVEVEPAFKRFRDQIQSPMEVVESGPIEVNAIYLELENKLAARSEFRRAVDIRHLREIIQEGIM